MFTVGKRGGFLSRVCEVGALSGSDYLLVFISDATSVHSFVMIYRLWWSGLAWFRKGGLQNKQAINFSLSIALWSALITARNKSY